MNIEEFLNNIDIDSIKPKSYQDNEYLNKVIRKANFLKDDSKETVINHAKLAIYLSNNLPYGVVRDIVELNK